MLYTSLPQRLSLQAYVTKKEGSCQKSNNPLCCAERRLLADLYRQAKVQGVQKHKTALWIHRKYKEITIIRETSYGLGSSFPCLICRASLERLDMRVNCVFEDKLQCVRITECKYESKLTTGQMLNNQPLKPCVVQSNRCTRRSVQTQLYNKHKHNKN
jgi:hypothetical protein